jgi:hypothetical protein
MKETSVQWSDDKLFQNVRLVARENSSQQAKLHQYRRRASAEEYFWNTGVTITHLGLSNLNNLGATEDRSSRRQISAAALHGQMRSRALADFRVPIQTSTEALARHLDS